VSSAEVARGVEPAHAVVAMVLLAGLDLLGALLAKRYADHRSVVTLVAGIIVFGALFLVYVRSLSYAELATVTFGWVVMLQVGVVVIDHVERGSGPPLDRVVAMAGMLLLQAYLVLGAMPRRS
jgi:hypothetical protein